MSCDDTEAELVRQASRGDRTALGQLLLLHHDAVRRHVSCQMAQEQLGPWLVDDILQQAFVRAAQGIATYEIRHPGSFRGWLKSIATNLIKDVHRKYRREPTMTARPFATGSSAADGSFVQGDDQVPGNATPPIKRVQRRENAWRLTAALASLPDEQRQIIESYYLQTQSLEQIAATTGHSVAALRGICYRARQKLRAMMGGSSLYFSG